MNWSLALFLQIQELTGNPLDPLMIFLAEYSAYIVIAGAGYLWLQQKQGKRDAALTGITVVSAVAFTYFMGLFYHHHPPFTQFETLVAEELSNAFPSQHTTTAFSGFLAFAWRRRRRLAYLTGLAALITGFGRIYIGVHYPVDIVGAIPAAFVGLAVAQAVNQLEIFDRSLETAKNLSPV